jgi:hypothetical protein
LKRIFKEVVVGYTMRYNPGIPLEGRGKTQKTSAIVPGVLAEIQHGQHLHMSQQHYHYSELFSDGLS